MFPLRKISSRASSAPKEALLLEIMSPADEKSCSLGTEVAGIVRYLKAKPCNMGKETLPWLYHHCRGSVISRSSHGSLRN